MDLLSGGGAFGCRRLRRVQPLQIRAVVKGEAADLSLVRHVLKTDNQG
jgi:hypothetical protein